MVLGSVKAMADEGDYIDIDLMNSKLEAMGGQDYNDNGDGGLVDTKIAATEVVQINKTLCRNRSSCG